VRDLVTEVVLEIDDRGCRLSVGSVHAPNS
jgi:hypothetical protein